MAAPYHGILAGANAENTFVRDHSVSPGA